MTFGCVSVGKVVHSLKGISTNTDYGFDEYYYYGFDEGAAYCKQFPSRPVHIKDNDDDHGYVPMIAYCLCVTCTSW